MNIWWLSNTIKPKNSFWSYPKKNFHLLWQTTIRLWPWPRDVTGLGLRDQGDSLMMVLDENHCRSKVKFFIGYDQNNSLNWCDILSWPFTMNSRVLNKKYIYIAYKKLRFIRVRILTGGPGAPSFPSYESYPGQPISPFGPCGPGGPRSPGSP